ncbi:unnamed protein product [Pleuronectes platessa]|uniref:RAB5 interacting factor n=2 Tax=Pleuronectes platessa TaxID=8262 RepID=A0A9N7Z5X8_PLEPL|nr:unnamed protein product [Pleuronectes platessa]
MLQFTRFTLSVAHAQKLSHAPLPKNSAPAPFTFLLGLFGLCSGRKQRMMTSSSKRKEDSHLQNGGVKQSAWSKALNSNAVWEEKDEFLDVIYWLRQIIAIILGVIWGVAPLKGFLGIAIFCVINAGVLYVYFSSFQQIDEEEYGGTWELTKEGFMTSFALFLVVWIIFYTALHFD